MSGETWPEMSPVMLIDEWPLISETTLSGTPLASMVLGGGVSEGVQADAGQVGLLCGHLERPERVAWVAGFAESRRERVAGRLTASRPGRARLPGARGAAGGSRRCGR